MPTPDVDLAPMRLAIAAARQALAAGDQPFGATLVSPAGQVLLTERNRQHTAADTSAHAETVLLRRAAEQLGPAALRGATVYASGEPCAMCAGALVLSRMRRLVYGAADPKAGACGSVLDVLGCERLNHTVEVTAGVLAEPCGAVLSEFFRERRGRKGGDA